MSRIAHTFLEKLNENPDYTGFWQDYRKYCKDFEITDNEMFVDSLPLLYGKLKNDVSSHVIYEAFKKYAYDNPTNAILIINILLEKATLFTLEYLHSFLVGLYDTKTNYPVKDKILKMIGSDNDDEINSGVRAAYQLNISNEENGMEFIHEVGNRLDEIITRKPKRNYGIITRFYIKFLNEIPKAKITIINLLELKIIDVQSEVAGALNEQINPHDDLNYFQACLNLLVYVDPKYSGVYSTIQYQLNEIADSFPDTIVIFINHWILNNTNNYKQCSVLEGTIHDLYTKNPQIIEKLFLDWLNSENPSYKNIMPFIIGDLSSNGVETVGLDKKSLKTLSDTDSLYITYMIVGYVHDRKYATEMLFNILEVKFNNEHIRNQIASLFVNYLIKNYYSITDILKSKLSNANKTLSSIINQVIEKSNLYYQQFSELESINEYEPSDKRMAYFIKQQSYQMQRLMDSPERKQPSFLDMVTNINLRAGKSFFSKYEGVYTEESYMQSFRSSVEMPRVQYIDEIGQEKLRLIWRNMKRNELPN